MRKTLQKKYDELCEYCNFQTIQDNSNIYGIIKNSLSDFVKQCREPAIWCFGQHTKMLMEDFIFELKGVHYIIDNGMDGDTRGGYEIIHESEIIEKHIDGIIISSRLYRDEIKAILQNKFRDIPFLDLYDKLENAGIFIEADSEYYKVKHPKERYCFINDLQRLLHKQTETGACRDILKQIVQFYIEIKDFRSAISYAKELAGQNEDAWARGLVERLEQLYELQISAMGHISENHVLMLCVDGLRRQDVCNGKLKKMQRFLQENTHFYNNAYSLSVFTYESLLPAYSENTDLRTKYYERSKIRGDECRFIQEAKKQKRDIYFYTDGVDYVSEDAISVIGHPQTVTEKFWTFLLDALSSDNGLFYIHSLYESHFPYPNPYTKNELAIKDWHILKDYLGREGGGIWHDYCGQQRDALKYLDDILIPFIENLPCRMVLYADHGNILLEQGTKYEDIESTKYAFHEDVIQVPLAIKAPEAEVGVDHTLISILELNNIIIELMKKQKFIYQKKKIIKAMRSEMYNLDFNYLYKQTGNERYLLAFEVFIFDEGYKLAVLSNGITELYDKDTDRRLNDVKMKEFLLRQVTDQITVCNSECLKIED